MAFFGIICTNVEAGSFPFLKPRQMPEINTMLPCIILAEFLMHPYVTNNREVLGEIEVYNYQHCRTRWKVECAFGIFVSKRRSL